MQSKYTTPEQIEAMRKEIQREKEKAAGLSNKLERKEKLKRALKILEWTAFLSVVAILVMSLFVVYEAKSKGEAPTLIGAFQLYEVKSGSMEPTLSIGSVIITRKTQEPENLEVNTIVTFRMTSDAVVTHRIIEVLTDDNGDVLYRTKGDNPINSPDSELLSPDRVIAVFVAKIPFT